MINLTQSYLNIELNGKNSIPELINCEANEDLLIDQKNFKCNGIVFRNCEFKAPFYALQTNIKAGIIFVNCKFSSLAHFSDLTSELEPMYENESISLKFDNVSFGNNLLFRNCHFKRDIKFINNSEIKQAHFEIVEITNGSISMNKSKINESFVLWDCKTNAGFRLINVESSGRLQFRDCHFNFFDINGSNLNKDLMILGGCILDMTFTSSTVKEEVLLKKLNIDSTIYLKNSHFYENFNVEMNDKGKVADIGTISINSTTFAQSFNVMHDFSDPLKIKKLKINSNDPNTGEINLTDLIIDDINITGINRYSIHLKNIYVCNFSLNNLSNSGTIRINNLQGIRDKGSRFVIGNSFLNETIFSNMIFNSFREIEIMDSDLSRIKANNVKWFKYRDINSGNNSPLEKWNGKLKRWNSFLQLCFYNIDLKEDVIKHLQNQREIFRQLKHAMIIEGDKIQSLVFKQYEMRSHATMLSLTRKIWNPDRLILELGKTNNHGQNWVKPIVLLLYVTIIFYPSMFIIANPNLFSFPSITLIDLCKDYAVLWQNLLIVPKILNPAHSVTNLFGVEKETFFWLYFFDILYKIIYAFFIFQIVTAFRKYVK
nr:hypothetical protein [Bacteroidota bacterium]